MQCTYEMGNYDKQIPIDMNDFPHLLRENGGFYKSPKLFSVDACIKDEMLWLWEQGVVTMGCCCGHNQTYSMVNVLNTELMDSLGYVKYPNRSDTYFLKSGCGIENLK